MGWKPGKYLKKVIKGIGKGIKKIGKGIGKAFKKVFKGLGKFIGKLGPIGMLGMMLLMPQLGAWWSQFGTWADTLVSSGKFFGNVMKGIHTAGAAVGNAYSTVTEGISNVIKSIPGVGDAYEGLTNWMSGTMDSAREFLGLETQQNRAFAKQLETLDTTSPNFDAAKAEKFYNAPSSKSLNITSTEDILPDFIRGPDGYIYNTTGMNAGEFATSMKEGTLNPFGQVLEQGAPPVLSGSEGYVAPKPQVTTTTDTKVTTDTGDTGADDVVKEKSKLDKAWTAVQTASTGYTLGQQIAGDIYGDEDFGYGGFVADVSIPLYDSYQTAQVDWTNQGYVGTPAFGAGNPGYFQSVINSYGTDPWYMYMQRTQQV